MSTPLNFDLDGLYIIMSDLGGNSRFHWTLYLETAFQSGEIFHLTTPDNSNEWVYENKPTPDMRDTSRLVVAIKVAVIEPDLHDALRIRLSEIPIQYSARFKEDVTCRVWLKEVLFELDNEGYIKLTDSVEGIEREVKLAAMRNKHRNLRSVIKSQGSVC